MGNDINISRVKMHWNLELKTSKMYYYEIKKLQKKSRMHPYFKTTKLVVHVPYSIGHFTANEKNSPNKML